MTGIIDVLRTAAEEGAGVGVGGEIGSASDPFVLKHKEYINIKSVKS